MIENTKTESDLALRKLAEQKFSEEQLFPGSKEMLSPDDTHQLLHDLRVHQIELEMQNEELQRTRNVLEFSRSRYFELYDKAPVSYLTVNVQGQILEANLTTTTQLGVTRQLLLMEELSRFILAEDQDIFYLLQKRAFENSELQTCELRMMKKDGTVFWVQLSASSALDPLLHTGQYTAAESVLFVVLNDITARKQAEKELQKKNAEIEQFTYSVSHDLRSPLVTINTFLGYLEQDLATNDTEKIFQDILYIHNAADKMDRLLHELLELSRIGRHESTPVIVSFRELIDEVLATLAGALSETQAVIEVSDMDLMLNGDRLRLGQIWQNLLENALKYRGDANIPHINIWFEHRDNETLFYVRDNGIGIAPENGDKIFGMFEKLDLNSVGAGLGLSMVKSIVEMYDGRIQVESSGEGQGSCFWFTLPKAMMR